MKILAGDIGGTKTILQLVEYQDGRLKPVIEKRYASQEFDTFERVLIQFYSEFKLQKNEIGAACIGVAGPVEYTGHRATSKITNLPWKLDSDPLADQFVKRNFILINDFQAIGYGIEQLSESDVIALQTGHADKKATKAVIGAGTGLGQAFLIWDDAKKSCNVYPSEAGHSSFAPVTLKEKQLLDYLSNRNDFVSLEQVVSGPGITNIYHFLSQQKSSMPGEVLLSANDSIDITPSIVKLAIEEEDPLAVETLNIFVSAYGAAAGNLALTVAATGGVYIAGGIAPKIISKMQDGRFVSAFSAKSKFKSWLQSIPIYLITNEKVGLLGAANYGLKSALSVDS